MDRIQNFCSDITIDIALEADYKSETKRLKDLGVNAKVDKMKQSIKIAKKSMTNHDFETAKRDLNQVKRDIDDIRSIVNSIEPNSNEFLLLNKICTGIASAVIIITVTFLGSIGMFEPEQWKSNGFVRLKPLPNFIPTKYWSAIRTSIETAHGFGISIASVAALHKFVKTRIERKAHFIKILDLCEASVNELISNCDAAEKKVSE